VGVGARNEGRNGARTPLGDLGWRRGVDGGLSRKEDLPAAGALLPRAAGRRWCRGVWVPCAIAGIGGRKVVDEVVGGRRLILNDTVLQRRGFRRGARG
jgi:hypothetical protein